MHNTGDTERVTPFLKDGILHSCLSGVVDNINLILETAFSTPLELLVLCRKKDTLIISQLIRD